MRKYFLVSLVLLLSLAVLGFYNPINEKQPVQQGKQILVKNLAWPEWSGPKTLGPGQPLPELWSIQVTHNYKPSYGYLQEISSTGEWLDKTPRKPHGAKGRLTPEEFAAVKEALAKINWNSLPKKSANDYTAYHFKPKEYLGPAGFLGYTVDYWAGQTNASTSNSGRRIMFDLKAPRAPEIKELIDTLKPLMEKYIDPNKNE